MDTSNWFDRINTAAITWWGIIKQDQPAIPAGNTSSGSVGGSVAITPGGIAAQASATTLLIGAAVIIAAIYLLRK